LQVVYSLYSTSYNLTFPFTNAAASTAPPPYDSRSISGGTLNGTVLWGALEACVTDFESTFYSNEALLGKWGGGGEGGYDDEKLSTNSDSSNDSDFDLEPLALDIGLINEEDSAARNNDNSDNNASFHLDQVSFEAG